MQENSWVPLIPEQASTFAWQVDALYAYLNVITAVFTIGIVAAVIFFAAKYRRKEEFANGKEIHGSIALETVWSIIPFVISMTIFLGGAIVYYNQYRPPVDAMEIYVVGKQWMWKIQHGTGQREINELHVPVGRRIKLTMTTEDVLHDFFVPAFRTKADVVPGRYTSIWFEAQKPGKYHLFCAEYCGLNHSGMGGWVYVMEQRDFDDWLGGNVGNQTPIEAGQDLFKNKLGCASCHEGTNQRGPSLENVFGSTVKLANGQTVVADDQYIRNSILDPASQIVEGYSPIMPTFKGQVTEEQLMQLVAYIKSLSNGNGTAAAPSAPAATSSVPMSNNANSSETMMPPKADRGKEHVPGSNPNTPARVPETTSSNRR